MHFTHKQKIVSECVYKPSTYFNFLTLHIYFVIQVSLDKPFYGQVWKQPRKKKTVAAWCGDVIANLGPYRE